MKEQITFNQLMTNPAGKGSAHLARRDEIISNLAKRAANAVQRKPPELAVFTEGDGYVFVFSIPSEELDLYYDVVLRFTSLSDGAKASKTIADDYGMQYFSNAAGFNYTYVFVLKRDGWLIPELEEKLSRKALTEPPDVRNPSGLWGFEKSVFFAALVMKEYDLTTKASLAKHLEGKVSWKLIRKNVKSFDEKTTEYEAAKGRAAKKRKAEKAKAMKIKKSKVVKATKRRSTAKSRLARKSGRK